MTITMVILWYGGFPGSIDCPLHVGRNLLFIQIVTVG